MTPKNSPVQPEKFTGYHTGTDAEYGDVADEVEVRAMVDGQVIVSRWVSGYGGVVVLKSLIKDETVEVLYGHLRPSSLVGLEVKVKQGEKIGVLGTGNTWETDGERKHLHLGIVKGDKVDFRGYVQKKEELSGWTDPLSLLVF